MAHIASVTIDTGLRLSNSLIETSGGTGPVVCHGHSKTHAVRLKNLSNAARLIIIAETALSGSLVLADNQAATWTM
jgi:hypothetical protein